LDALERGDLDAWSEATRDLLDPDCEFNSAIGTVVGGGSYKGREAIRNWFGDLIESTSARHWRNRRWETHGDTIVVYFADFNFTGAGSGATVEAENAGVAEFEDGVCVRMQSFMSWAEAREYVEARVA
jgi:ketosteroid isomerase-like protein